MKQYQNIVWMAVMLLGCASCGQDEETTLRTDSLPEGTCIVDYTAETESGATRATAAERISSLHYLLYDGDTGELLKEKEIPNIGSDTQWPLKRETMTWAQREALQDTLSVNENYKVVFVANIKPTLFGGDHPEVLRNKEDYTAARLYLPNVAFSESTMYYWWTGEIKAEATSHDTPYKCNVLLRRLVTKTDVNRIGIPDKTAFIKDAVENQIFTLSRDGWKGQIDKSIGSWAIAARTAATFASLYTYIEPINKLETMLTSQASFNKMIATVEGDIMSKLCAMVSEDQLKDWSDKVKVSYSSTKKRATNIDFERKAYTDDLYGGESEYTVSNGTFSMVGFAGGADLNEVSSLAFYSGSETTTPSLTVSGTPWNTEQGINTYYAVVCNPIGTLNKVGNNTVEYRCQLRDLLQWTATGLGFSGDFSAFESFVDGICNTQSATFGTGFNDFILPLQLPASLDVKPIWDKEKK